MKQRCPAMAALGFALLIAIQFAPFSQAANKSINLSPGDSITINCHDVIGVVNQNPHSMVLSCPELPPTVVATPTRVPPVAPTFTVTPTNQLGVAAGSTVSGSVIISDTDSPSATVVLRAAQVAGPDAQVSLLPTANPWAYTLRVVAPTLTTTATIVVQLTAKDETNLSASFQWTLQVLPSQSLPPLVVGVLSDTFTINGKPTFLAGVSYCDAWHWRESDLVAINKAGYNLIRIWLDWRDRGFFNRDGTFKAGAKSRLQLLVARSQQLGLVVNVTILDETMRLSAAGKVNAVQQVGAALAGYTNVIYDLYNGWDYAAYSRDELAVYSNAIKRVDADAIYGASSLDKGFINPTRESVYATRIDEALDRPVASPMLIPHLPRTSDWYTRANDRVDALQAYMATRGWSRPIFLQEETRRGWKTMNPSEAQYLQAGREAKQAGAAAFLFHTAAGFDLDVESFMTALDNVERGIFEKLPDEVGLTTPAAPAELLGVNLVEGATLSGMVAISVTHNNVDEVRFDLAGPWNTTAWEYVEPFIFKDPGWDTTLAADGAYTITITGYDVTNQQAGRPIIRRFTVDNEPAPLPTTTPTPTLPPATAIIDDYLIDAGLISGTTSAGGKVWEADTYSTNNAADRGALSVDGTDLDVLFNTVRGSTTLLDYNIPNTVGQQYTITLYFVEQYHTAAGAQVFDISIDGVLVSNDLDVFAEAGGKLKALAKSYRFIGDGNLDLELDPSINRAEVAAIHIYHSSTGPAPTPTPNPNTPNPNTPNPNTPNPNTPTATRTSTPVPPAPIGPNYYIAPSGSTSSCGSRSNPCRAPQHLPNMADNAVITIAAGSYNGNWEIRGRHKATFIASAGWTATLNGSLRIWDANDSRLSGLKIQGASSHGVIIDRSPRFNFDGNWVHNTGDDCIDAHASRQSGTLWGDPWVFSDGLIIQNNRLTECGTQGIFITAMNPTIRNNLIDGVGVESFSVRVHGVYSKSYNALIEGNTVRRVAHNGLSVRNTSIVRGNIISQIGQSWGSSSLFGGNCIKFFNDGPQDGGLLLFENNVCYAPGPQFAGAYAVDGCSETHGEGYTAVIRNNSSHTPGNPGITIQDFGNGMVYAQYNVLTRSDSGSLITGSAGRQTLSNNTIRTNDHPGQTFISPASGDLRLTAALQSASNDPIQAASRIAFGKTATLTTKASSADKDITGRTRTSPVVHGAYQ